MSGFLFECDRCGAQSGSATMGLLGTTCGRFLPDKLFAAPDYCPGKFRIHADWYKHHLEAEVPLEARPDESLKSDEYPYGAPNYFDIRPAIARCDKCEMETPSIIGTLDWRHTNCGGKVIVQRRNEEFTVLNGDGSAPELERLTDVYPDGLSIGLRGDALTYVAPSDDVSTSKFSNAEDTDSIEDLPVDEINPIRDTDSRINTVVKAERATKKYVRFLKREYPNLRTWRYPCFVCHLPCLIALSGNTLKEEHEADGERVEIVCAQCKDKWLPEVEGGTTAEQAEEYIQESLKRTVRKENMN